MPVKRRYSSPAPIEVKSYSFTDNVTRTGYITLYGTKSQSNYFLMQQQSFSDTVATITAAAAEVNEALAEASPDLTLNFDIEFKAPQYIEGDIIIQVPHGFRDSGNQVTAQKVRTTTKHVRGADVTDIIVITGSTFQPAITAAVDSHFAMSTMSGTVPKTHFTVGDKLRVTAELMTWETGGNSHTYMIGHDPMGRETSGKDSTVAHFSGGEFTTFRVDVPFKIQ